MMKRAGEASHASYRVKSVSKLDATTAKFSYPFPDGIREISVAQYFAMEPYKYDLKYPNLNVLLTGSAGNPRYLPMEVSYLALGYGKDSFDL